MFEVKDKVALVTGGASGIGLGYVNILLENGAKGISIVDISKEIGEKVTEELNNKYPNQVIFIHTDVTKEHNLKAAFQTTTSKFKDLHIVINNAGIFDERNWRKTIEINLIAAISGINIGLDEFLKLNAEDRVIFNTASIYGYKFYAPLSSAYNASKNGLLGFLRGFSQQERLIQNNIRLLSLCPGLTMTGITTDEAGFKEELKALATSAMTNIKMQRPEDVAAVMLEMVKVAKNGEVWAIENFKKYKISWPTDFGEENTF